MNDFIAQLRHTVRSLARAPLFAGVAVLTLAVGIGSTAAIYSVVDGVLLEPLPFEDPDQLVGVWHTAPGLGFDQINQSPALHAFYADESRSFTSVGMWDDGSATVTGADEPEQVTVILVTWQTLPMLGVRPALGRTFSETEDSPEGPATLLLSHAYWTERFGADRDILGRSVTVDGTARQVIGVLPEGLRFLQSAPELYLPFRRDPATLMVGNFAYQGIARLRDGVTLEQANADVARMIPLAVDRYPGMMTRGMLEEARFAPDVHPLKEDVVGDVGSVLWVLMGTVGVVLLIACANVANLFLVRAEGRQREVAVRTALGASRSRVAWETMTEALVLGALGGVAGLALAFVGLKLLVAMGPESLPRLEAIGIDGSVLAFTLGISLVAGLFFGSFATVRLGRGGLAASLREGGRGGSAGRERHRIRDGLVMAQMALALVLLVGSGLMVRSFRAMRAVDPGFTDPEAVLTFRVAIPSAEIADPLEVASAHERILQGVRALPGVTTAGFTSSVTMDGWDSNDPLESEAHPVQGSQIPPIRRYKSIGPDYFATMGNTLLAGRDLTWADLHDRSKVVVVSEALAREEWGDATSAIGQRVRAYTGPAGTGSWWEVVGVSADAFDDGVEAGPVAIVYWPALRDDVYGDPGPTATRSLAYVVRVRSGDPRAILPAVRDAVWTVDPDLPVARVRTLRELADRSMARTSFTLIMLGIASGVALFLGLVGIYGVISYVVALRTREIGVRMAMGAAATDVRRLVLGQAGRLAGAGVAVGLIMAALTTRLMASLLYGVEPLDPPTFAAVAGALAAVALLASWIPARRASRVDPVVALRSEG